MRVIIYSLILFFLLPSSVIGKEQSVTGTILAFNLYPLKGVTVTAKKSNIKTVTNEKGEFEIVMDEKDILILEADGFYANRRKIKKYSNPLEINLVFKGSKESVKQAVSNNHIREEDLAYGISNFSFSNIDYSMYTSIYDMIRASFPNVVIIYENGVTRFQIRGNKSLMASNAALVVVNGMAINNGNIDFLSPYDVKNVEILKGPSATAYGSRGANGVVLIETRRKE